MGHAVRIAIVATTGLLLTGCLSSEPKVAEIDQISAEQRAAMQATEETGGEGGGAGPAQFVAADIMYEQAPEEVPAGTVPMTLVNEGTIEHNVVIEELGEDRVLDAAAGETDSAEVELQPGDYTYYCDVAGHRAAGMEGTLTATE
jgi:plastocyanin